jgi:hypothetical protein
VLVPSNDADDFAGRELRLALVHLEVLANGILAREIAFCERLVNDNHARGVCCVLASEISAREQRDSHGLEVASRNNAVIGVIEIALVGHRVLSNVEERVISLAAER